MPFPTPPRTNADGLIIKEPPALIANMARANQAFAAREGSHLKVLMIDFDLALTTDAVPTFSADLNNDGTPDGFSDADPHLPPHSSVVRVTLLTTQAAAGGTSFTVGTYQQGGTAISANNLVTATEGVLANVNAIGKRVYGAGALTAAAAGTAGSGALRSYVALTPSGTFTAGRVRCVIEYMDSLGAP